MPFTPLPPHEQRRRHLFAHGHINSRRKHFDRPYYLNWDSSGSSKRLTSALSWIAWALISFINTSKLLLASWLSVVDCSGGALTLLSPRNQPACLPCFFKTCFFELIAVPVFLLF